MKLLRPIKLATIALLLSAGLIGEAHADNLEYRVKAVYLYNFIKFVDWSNPPKKSKICTYGENPFGQELQELSESVQTKNPVEIVKIEQSSLKSIAGLDCQVLFIGSLNSPDSKLLTQLVLDHETVTVSDQRSDTLIRFVNIGEKVKFAVNPELAERCKAQISSKLKSLAVEYK